MEQSELGTRSVPGLVMKLAIPMIVAQLVNGLYSIVDRIYIIRSYLYIKNHENIERNPNLLPAFDTTIL